MPSGYHVKNLSTERMTKLFKCIIILWEVVAWLVIIQQLFLI